MFARTTFASLVLLAAATNAGRSHSHKRAPNATNKVIVQMFGWNWNSIAAECSSFLGPAGIGFVQVNPPQEHIAGDQWWVDYQVVSYQLQSRRGSRAEFAAMIGQCKNAGVSVIVDTIWNHMAGVDSGTGTAGSQFTHYNYPGIYIWNDFHHCGLTKDDDIVNWNDRNQFQNCELSNLADLNTSSDYVRNKIAEFTNDMLSLGVEGLRLDAAKHMAAEDVRAIISKLSRRPAYITQEVPDSGMGLGREYTDMGDVQDFRYPETLKAAFLTSGIAGLKGIENLGWPASDRLNVFVANHDRERDQNVLTYKDDSRGNLYTLAHVFMFAYPYGTPTILSSYSFTNRDAGAPNGAYGTCTGSQGTNGWLCQHRWIPMAGMVKFYNTVNGSNLNNWVQGSKQQIAFGRGNAGFVAINNENSVWTRTFKTSLPDETYCDAITGRKSINGCTGYKVTVKGGSFTATIPARSAIAYYIGAKL